MLMQKIHSDLIYEIKKILSPLPNKLFIEKQDGAGLIQVFSENGMNKGDRNKFKKVENKNYQVEPFLLLMIVIPDDKKNKIQKKNQLEDLRSKIKDAINFSESELKDFIICQISDFREILKSFLIKYGFSRYAQML